MDDCPRLCETCPMVPQGVTAAPTGAMVVTTDELDRLRFAVEAPAFAAPFVGNTRIHTTVVASVLPHVDVGDTASMLVGAGGKGYDELKEVVLKCKGPIYTRFQKIFKFLGPRGRCGAMNNRKTVYLDENG